MKILLPTLFLLMLFSQNLWAKAEYELTVNDQGYNLAITLEFNQYQSLQLIRQALVNSEVLAGLSPNIVSVTYSGEPADYQSLMVVKSFGLKSELMSKCQEVFEDSNWKRSCVLQTDILDGGKYMVSKSDLVECKKENAQNTICRFLIKGKTKNLSVLGIQILNERSFAVKAKIQALINFFKIYFYAKDSNLSLALANFKYENSGMKNELKLLDKEAIQVLKDGHQYHHRFQLKE